MPVNRTTDNEAQNTKNALSKISTLRNSITQAFNMVGADKKNYVTIGDTKKGKTRNRKATQPYGAI